MNGSHEEACARVAALYRPRWLRHYAASKLRRDAIFARAFELLHGSSEPILDVGCGIGLLPFYLRERGLHQRIVALDIDGRKLAHAREIASSYEDIVVIEQDGDEPLPEFCGSVTLFDVLHYLAPDRQREMLREIADRLAPDGTLLIRDCPRDGSPRFWATYVAERFAQAIAWNVRVPLHFPKRDELGDAFDARDFIVVEEPMYRGGPFNNRLFTLRRRAPAVAPAAG
ncbi:MAG TPA: class I SAM-dependent methyltransferase [Chthoniobacterales bacterium]